MRYLQKFIYILYQSWTFRRFPNYVHWAHFSWGNPFLPTLFCFPHRSRNIWEKYLNQIFSNTNTLSKGLLFTTVLNFSEFYDLFHQMQCTCLSFTLPHPPDRNETHPSLTVRFKKLNFKANTENNSTCIWKFLES